MVANPAQPPAVLIAQGSKRQAVPSHCGKEEKELRNDYTTQLTMMQEKRPLALQDMSWGGLGEAASGGLPIAGR